ncbi:hypothetical protein PHLGIDRAFT_38179 [Phlebiopsis gigantea 11061_1 CR5-6]|uniref:Mitochondrial distribution and morphology protein 35 n=1 Tax=Phlebiopsis gigantea (strain 11061_1 CR5-6) TaxID=745531 RepID=A0A0C3RZC4_PHLG1|nr:hypothetical protein PHLGIDRAFT_38179 [Phlebiopsis gigantea 11061_1 CR5-6]
MASSLSDECTPMKREYDSCFNAWFEGYLEPAVSATPAERLKYTQDKAEEYEAKCGRIWSQYQKCVQRAVRDKGLETLLAQARADNPLKEPPSLHDSQRAHAPA